MTSPSSPMQLRLAVVGHTNTGKTSLLRTLTRDPRFGQVRDQPGTTRHVQGVRLPIDEHRFVELYDTPGLEDSMALLDYLDELSPVTQRREGPDRINLFLASPESTRRFEQEARVLRKLLSCDAALYVIDVRDPFLGKYRDELTLLGLCARPILPILNFTNSPAQKTQIWRAGLARLGLHASVEFDTVAPPLDGEMRLYERLALLLEPHALLLQALNDSVLLQQRARLEDAWRLVAELLIDAAAIRYSCPPDQDSIQRISQTLRKCLREREQACVQALLQCYNFQHGDFPRHTLPLEGERWGMDLFHPQALKDMGIHVGKGMAAGAMAGATVDMFTAGLSLGTATLAGAVAGGLWQSADRLGKRLLGRLQGFREITVDDAVLGLLALRQMTLIQALQRRGHAAQTPIVLDADASGLAWQALRAGTLPEELNEARSQPQWASMSDHFEDDQRRSERIHSLAHWLGQ